MTDVIEAIAMTAIGEATVPRTIGTTTTVTATETVVTTTVNDAAVMMMKMTTTIASESANVTGLGRLRSTTEGDRNERLCG
jgi:hypothetical protein